VIGAACPFSQGKKNTSRAKVMQFLITGRYIAAVSDAKITHFRRTK
jgi:hypothetical protein